MATGRGGPTGGGTDDDGSLDLGLGSPGGDGAAPESGAATPQRPPRPVMPAAADESPSGTSVTEMSSPGSDLSSASDPPAMAEPPTGEPSRRTRSQFDLSNADLMHGDLIQPDLAGNARLRVFPARLHPYRACVHSQTAHPPESF